MNNLTYDDFLYGEGGAFFVTSSRKDANPTLSLLYLRYITSDKKVNFVDIGSPSHIMVDFNSDNKTLVINSPREDLIISISI
ncbi:hypothetical protein Xvie_00051 [Xenorhabdus vietnamensis]|uniref:Uncharacterized protein n=1 Tax=Xenorhabdus vietnamensis TaxID=351656 RepID=A0A1Y2SKW8_9GAMM|nr:hypothetical protein [Xenorhabdus vietnamensis]OTA18233.1 hypothetical protein Xvie_00051 [Xenorhabdus vietnamensis]